MDSASSCTKNTKLGHDNGELAEVIYNMDLRLDELTRTCNGLRTSIHTLTKMVTQLVHNQTRVRIPIITFLSKIRELKHSNHIRRIQSDLLV